MRSIELIHYFLAVARHQSFVKAAADLNCAHSSVSRKIAQLEKDLGISLFTRSTRKVALTDAGCCLQEQVRPLLNNFDNLLENLREMGSQIQGTVKISCPHLFANQYLSQVLPKIVKKWPKLSLQITAEEKIVDLNSGDVDICIRNSILPDSGLIAKQIYAHQFYIVTSPKYLQKTSSILKPADLATHNLLPLKMPSYYQRWQFSKNGHKESVSITDNQIATNDLLLLYQMVKQGLGIGMFLDSFINYDLDQGSLIRLLTDYEVSPHQSGTGTYLLYTKERGSLLRVQIVLDFLLKELRELYIKKQPLFLCK